MYDPQVGLPPLDRHGSVLIKTFSMSWENQPDDLLQEFIQLTDGSSGQKITIFDTGIDDKHPYLRGIKIATATDYTNSRTGWSDFNDHGTFVASQIYRRCPNAEFDIRKVLGDSGGGSSSGIVKALHDAVEAGTNFCNASLGAGSRYDPMGDALRELQKRNGLYFAASGNSGGPRVGWPAGWGPGFNVVPTGAFRKDGKRSSFSDWGQVLLCMGAGENIIGAKARTQGQTKMSGTSMGCPSACSLTMGYHSARLAAGHTDITTESSLISLIQSIATDVENAGRDIYTGVGNLTLAGTVAAIKKLETKVTL